MEVAREGLHMLKHLRSIRGKTVNSSGRSIFDSLVPLLCSFAPSA